MLPRFKAPEQRATGNAPSPGGLPGASGVAIRADLKSIRSFPPNCRFRASDAPVMLPNVVSVLEETRRAIDLNVTKPAGLLLGPWAWRRRGRAWRTRRATPRLPAPRLPVRPRGSARRHRRCDAGRRAGQVRRRREVR